MRGVFNRTSGGIVVAVAVLFTAGAAYVADSTSRMMEREAEGTVRSVVRGTVGKIDRLMTRVELAALNSSWIVGEHLDDPDYMYKITRELVGNNEFIVGSAVAFEPMYFGSKGRYFSPYTCVGTNGTLNSFQLGTESYRYHEMEWYRAAKEGKRPRWCEPYYDDGGGAVLMSTYSVPIKNAAGEVFAVLTSDISLAQLTQYVASLRPYPESFATMKTEKGAYLVAPPKDRTAVNVGETITICEKADNGWTVEIVCPTSKIRESARKLVFGIVIFSVLGLLLIFMLAWVFSIRLARATAARERIESELAISSRIQSDILPKEFPRGIAAKLRPAREVGGDLYDFVERDGRLYFVVGDASGKGVPAALFSFMAVTAFRIGCKQGLPPAEIVGHINGILTKGNEMCMFVTLFVGMVDLKTGRMAYCSAGHNEAVAVARDGTARFLPAKRNIPAGAMDDYAFAQQETDFGDVARLIVYTDGVTEAERADHSQFGNDRLLAFASGKAAASATEITEGLFAAVDGFTAGAEQSDDITVMVVGRA